MKNSKDNEAAINQSYSEDSSQNEYAGYNDAFVRIIKSKLDQMEIEKAELISMLARVEATFTARQAKLFDRMVEIEKGINSVVPTVEAIAELNRSLLSREETLNSTSIELSEARKNQDQTINYLRGKLRNVELFFLYSAIFCCVLAIILIYHVFHPLNI